MSASLHYVVYSAVMTWLMLYVAATLRTRAWTAAGLKTAFGINPPVGSRKTGGSSFFAKPEMDESIPGTKKWQRLCSALIPALFP